jgi:glycerophosphoryl diester phosphodiesterase
MMFKSVVAVTAISLLSVLSAAAVEIIGHRGASYDAPENTITSTRLAYEQGADGSECDVYLTKDGKVMLMHDASTYRTAGVSNKMAVTTSKELRKLDVGKWDKFKDAGFSEKIPLLKEVLAVIPDGKRMFVEIKCGVEVLPQLEKDLAKSRKKPGQIVLICFDYDVIKAAKAKMPQYKALWLVSKDRKANAYPAVEDMIRKAKEAKLDGLDLFHGFPIDKAFVAKVHGAGLELYTWTVDDPVVARAEAEAGVDGITTNRPKWLREQLATSVQ